MEFIMKSIITKLAVHNGIYNLVDNKDEDTKSNNNFLISAHRNYISSDIENTKEYILLMNDNDYVSYIEIDARLTKDKKIILSHDNDLIVDGKHQKIADLTYEEEFFSEQLFAFFQIVGSYQILSFHSNGFMVAEPADIR